MSDQPTTIFARSVWTDHLGRFVVCGASATPHDGRIEYVLKSVSDARLADAEAMAEALRFVADQAITDEIPARDRETMPRMSKAWNDGYDAAVLRVRAALEKWRAGK